MNAQEARNYIKSWFDEDLFSELRSYMHEVTDDGVFNETHIELMDDETVINVAEDIKYQIRQEVGYLI